MPYIRSMRFETGDRVILLENMSFRGGEKAQPLASAIIIDYNENAATYTIEYELFGSGDRGQIEVPEDRLTIGAGNLQAGTE